MGITRVKKRTLLATMLLVASMGLMVACSGGGDDDNNNNNNNGGPTGGTGNTTCVDITPCPNGSGMIGFCVNEGATSCYYTLNGRNYQCAGCTTQQGLQSCAQNVVNACGR